MEAVAALAREPSLSVKTAAFVLGYAGLAFAAYPSTFGAVLGAYPILRYYAVIPPLILIGLLIAAVRHRRQSPLTFMRDKLVDRGLGGLIVILVLVIGASAFTTLKHEFSFLVPFFADQFLADLDYLLHFGDPWRHLRAITPAVVEPVLFSLYSQLWFVEVAGVVVYAAFVADRASREQYLASFALSAIVLSSVVRLAGSSAGPIFYDRIHGGQRYGDLIAALQSSWAGQGTLQVTNYLFDSYTTQTSVLGTGISAMPSLHVALAFLNALYIGSRHRIAGYAAWGYAAIILYGSVYFGWHYALDGYVSILVMLLFWRLSAPAQR